MSSYSAACKLLRYGCCKQSALEWGSGWQSIGLAAIAAASWRAYLGTHPFFLLNLQLFLASPFLHFFLDFFAVLQSFLTCFFESFWRARVSVGVGGADDVDETMQRVGTGVSIITPCDRARASQVRHAAPTSKR